MNTINVALMKEKGISFAVVLVKQHAMIDINLRKEVIGRCRLLFQCDEVVLAYDNYSGTKYYGRHVLTNFLRQYPASSLPFKQYKVS